MKLQALCRYGVIVAAGSTTGAIFPLSSGILGMFEAIAIGYVFILTINYGWTGKWL